MSDPAAINAARAAGHAVATAHMAAHARGAPAYAAVAARLASAGDPFVSGAELDSAILRASIEVREAMWRLPLPRRGRGELGALIATLDLGIRDA